MLLIVSGCREKIGVDPSDSPVIQELKQFISGANVDLNAPFDETGNRAIHVAVREDDPVLIRYLVAKGVDLNIRNSLKMTPLHLVKSSLAASILLTGGADPLQENRAGDTPLHQVKDTEIAELLLDHGVPVDCRNQWQRTPLHNAAIRGDTALVLMLLDRGAQINAVDKSGRTPLHSSDKKKLDLVKLLIDRGADPEIRRASIGDTVLHNAAERGTVEVVEYLISRECDVRDTDKFGFTPLHFARTPEIAGRILDRGAALEIRSKAGLTPVWTSLLGEGTESFQRRGGGFEVMKLLVDRGADLHVRDNDGSCMLHFAVYFGPEAVSYLLKKGLSPDIKNSQGKTPLDMARRFMDQKIIKLMESYKTD